MNHTWHIVDVLGDCANCRGQCRVIELTEIREREIACRKRIDSAAARVVGASAMKAKIVYVAGSVVAVCTKAADANLIAARWKHDIETEPWNRHASITPASVVVRDVMVDQAACGEDAEGALVTWTHLAP